MSDNEEPTETEPPKAGPAKAGFFRRLFKRADEVSEAAVGGRAPEPAVDPDVVTVAAGQEAPPSPAAQAYLVPEFPVPEPETPALPDPAGDEAAPAATADDPSSGPERSPAPPALEPDFPEPTTPAPTIPAPTMPEPAVAEPTVKRSWWTRLREGLARSSASIGTGIGDIFTKRKLDDSMLDDLEDVLIRADLGVTTATRIREAVAKGRYDKDVSPEEVKDILAGEVERVLTPYAAPIAIEAGKKPFVILVVGVNGSGKTTTIGKLAAKFTAEGRQVMLAAGDTFRAAAIAQLTIWGDRLGCAVVAREQGSDAAGLAYEAIETARAKGADILLMDTAGRLQNRTELMAELEKIIRVMRKLDPAAPHAVLLVLDATVGQNAMSQVEIFGRVAGVTGLVMTKLDGTARGGILVAITEKFRLPVHFIGVGETQDDLEPFAARDFAAAIAGLDRETSRRK